MKYDSKFRSRSLSFSPLPSTLNLPFYSLLFSHHFFFLIQLTILGRKIDELKILSDPIENRQNEDAQRGETALRSDLEYQQRI